ncbi:glycosyltransferase [Flavobacterium sp.]|uniref:glycosyltransferase n=1 Tax=Flavobacterium sp. TaxID=239 RepID=UPI002FD9256D
METLKPKILVAPLNWGLGHATRCIPIIKALLENNFEPVIASDGVALHILQKEFPELIFLELPSYQIEYAKKGAFFKWKLIKNSPKMMEAIYLERKMVKKWVKEYGLAGIISDNRLGIYSKKVPSVFITHQLNVLTGNTSWITSKLHQYIIKKYDECWVPDVPEIPNLTGKLGHLKNPHFKINYIGPLSRLNKKEVPKKYDLMVILSGPEPQRTMLEVHLKEEIKRYKGEVVFVCGVIEPEQKLEQIDHITFYNFMTSAQLEQTFNESELVLCRSGYTTVMDLAKLGKKCFFIPTPGQFEQEYLAKKYKRDGLIPYAKQEKFVIENLYEVDLYKGLHHFKTEINWKQLFLLFDKSIKQSIV